MFDIGCGFLKSPLEGSTLGGFPKGGIFAEFLYNNMLASLAFHSYITRNI